jgi:hypothetical protein
MRALAGEAEYGLISLTGDDAGKNATRQRLVPVATPRLEMPLVPLVAMLLLEALPS